MRRLALVAVVALAGCGQSLSSSEKIDVNSAEADLASYELDGNNVGEAMQAVDDLIAMCRAKGGADYDGRTVRQAVEDAANELRDNDAELAGKLDRVLDSGCE